MFIYDPRARRRKGENTAEKEREQLLSQRLVRNRPRAAKDLQKKKKNSKKKAVAKLPEHGGWELKGGTISCPGPEGGRSVRIGGNESRVSDL